MELREKQAALQKHLRELRRVAVAYSGGVDSAYLLLEATRTLGPENTLGILAVSPSLPLSEKADAERLAAEHDLPLLLIETDEGSNPNYASNPIDRCYFCKSTLYTQAIPIAQERGFEWIANGTNADDLGDWRPGLKAAEENSVAHPLLTAGLTKQDIRDLAREAGLDVWDKPAAACLASRIPHGTSVTPERLKMVERAEDYLKETIGLRVVRVRWEEGRARIECGPEEMDRAKDALTGISAAFSVIGFESVTIDPRGYRRGSLHEDLEEEKASAR